MRTVFNVEIKHPIGKKVGVFSNKSIAFDEIKAISNNSQIVFEEESEKYSSFYNKTFNYINFTKYFNKSAKNKTALRVKMFDKNDSTLYKIVECTMFVVNER